MNEHDARAHLRVFNSIGEHKDLQNHYETWMERNKGIITDVLVQFSTTFSNNYSIRYNVAVFFNLKPNVKKDRLKD